MGFEVVTTTVNAKGEEFSLRVDKDLAGRDQHPVRLYFEDTCIAMLNMENQAITMLGEFAQFDGDVDTETAILMLVNSMMASSVYANAFTTGTSHMVSAIISAALGAVRKAGKDEEKGR